MGKAMVFIDGSNFYFKLKSLTAHFNPSFPLLHFPFARFAQWLTEGNTLMGVRYYIGALKRQRGNEKSEKLYADQQKLLASLQQQKITTILGHIIQHPDRSFHEKGVDVRLAVEMIRFARENHYDIAYLISSDTDLVPAVEEVKSFGRKVVYIGTSKGQSFGLTKTCDDTRLIRPEEIENLLKNLNPR